jgi:hypothetical protein
MEEPQVLVTVASVRLDDGAEVARIERVTIGGGTQTVTVDGVPEERRHPMMQLFHVHLISPDRMIPDQLHDAQTYDEAVELALAYGRKRVEHAAQVDALAASLRV